MWWLSTPQKPINIGRLIGFFFLIVLVSGCGIHPLYGYYPNTPQSIATKQRLADIYVAIIPNRDGQELRQELLGQLTYSSDDPGAKCILKVDLSRSIAGLVNSSDGTASLAEVTTAAPYKLTCQGKPMLSGTAMFITSSEFIGPRYGSVADERAAEDSGIKAVAVQIYNRVISYANNPQASTTKPLDITPGQRYLPYDSGTQTYAPADEQAQSPAPETK